MQLAYIHTHPTAPLPYHHALEESSSSGLMPGAPQQDRSWWSRCSEVFSLQFSHLPSLRCEESVCHLPLWLLFHTASHQEGLSFLRASPICFVLRCHCFQSSAFCLAITHTQQLHRTMFPPFLCWGRPEGIRGFPSTHLTCCWSRVPTTS